MFKAHKCVFNEKITLKKCSILANCYIISYSGTYHILDVCVAFADNSIVSGIGNLAIVGVVDVGLVVFDIPHIRNVINDINDIIDICGIRYVCLCIGEIFFVTENRNISHIINVNDLWRMLDNFLRKVGMRSFVHHLPRVCAGIVDL